uniref:Uncharacterized protein n=1 Tax=Avena sativa TaxID=4498 RepID=A0ACD5UBD2_AVESA
MKVIATTLSTLQSARRIMPLSLITTLALILASLLLLPAAAVADNNVRRVLHEPLFPIQWTPPPGFSSNPDNGGPALLPPPPPPPNTVSADVSSTTGPAPRVRGGGGGTPKAAIVVASAAAAAFLALLAFAAAFLLTGRLSRHPVQPHSAPVPTRPAAGHATGSEADVQAAGSSSTASRYRSDRARRGICRDVDTVPSPELRPLPPLRRGSSDEEAAEYYTPGQRSASAGSGGGTGTGTWSEASASSPRTTTTSRRSLPSLTSDFFSGTPAAAPAPYFAAAPTPAPPAPRSRRTPPRTRFSASNPPAAPPPPPPPQPQTSNNNTVPKPPPPPPPSAVHRSLKPVPPSTISVRTAPVTATIKDNVHDGGSSMSMPTRTHDDEDRPKLKPLHWDKLRASSDDRDMVWDRLKSNSFQLDEDTIDALFMNNPTAAPPPKKAAGVTQLRQEERILDRNKAHNIAILLRALNVTLEELSDALLNGNAECLGAELLETLVKMAPTKEEEHKLRNFTGELSKLGSAERFLKAVLDIPFAFKRVDAMLYQANFESEITYLRKSFQTLEAACDDLKGSRLFLKLLEAVLRTGNRMNVGTNRGEAKAFKLDTLLKLADIKGADGKTTVLHFVVQEIVRSEDEKSGRAAAESHITNTAKDIQFRRHGLKVVSGLSSELGNVKKAATMDFDVLHGYVSKLETGLGTVSSVIRLEEQCATKGGEKFFAEMRGFLKEAEQGIGRVRCEERKALERVNEITNYFHGNTAKEEAHPLRIFMVVRDFVSILDRVCREVGQQDRTPVGSFRVSATAVSRMLNVPGQHGRDAGSDEDS